MDHGWLVNPKRRRRKTRARRRKSHRRMPAALARYWRTHKRRGRRIVATRSHSRRRTHRKRRAVTKGYGAAWLPAHYSNPSVIKEVAMFGLNPRRRRRHARRHHYRHNPRRHGRGARVGVMSMIQNPMDTVTKGLVGSVGVFLPIATANWLLPFPGVDIMSRLLRFATRAAAAGLIVQFGSRMVGRSADALKTGAFIGVAGSTVLDFLGTAVLIGRGDTGQVPQQLLAGFMQPATTTATGTAGLGAAYTAARRIGVGAAYTAQRRIGMGGLHGQQSLGTGFKHGLLGGL